MGFQMLWLDGQKRLVVCLRQIVVMLLAITVGPEVERCEVTAVHTKHAPIFLEGIVPLHQIDIGFSLPEPQVDTVGVEPYLLHQHRYGVAPLLRCLCTGA